MRHRHALAQWGVVLGLLIFLTSPALAESGRYYLSLGTSLSVGIQPDPRGSDQLTDEGYADQLHRLLQLKRPRLQLVRLGCPEETTDKMISGKGTLCEYPAGSQLKEAVAFLQANSGAVSLVTIDMGANDLLACGEGGIIDPVCVSEAFANVAANLPVILSALRAAAPGARIVAINYYNPFLAAWLQGEAGQELAVQSAVLAGQFNDLLEATYAFFGVPVGDVAGAFHSDDFRLVPGMGVPVNVVLICQLTWMCAPFPRGPDVHANRVGYFVIALALAATLN